MHATESWPGSFQQKMNILKGYLLDHRIIWKARKVVSENRAALRETGQRSAQTKLRNAWWGPCLTDMRCWKTLWLPCPHCPWAGLFSVPDSECLAVCLCHSLLPSCQRAERVNMGRFHLLRWEKAPMSYLESHSGEFHEQGSQRLGRDTEIERERALSSACCFNF